MKRSQNRFSFLLLLFISIAVHIVFLIVFFLYLTKNIKPLRELSKASNAKVIFRNQKPRKKALPLQSDFKIQIPKLTAGNPELGKPQEHIDPKEEEIKPDLQKPISSKTPEFVDQKKKIIKAENSQNQNDSTSQNKRTTILKNQIEQPKKITLADITKSFLQKAQTEKQKNNSNHLIKVTGEDIGPATEYQIKLEQYGKKISREITIVATTLFQAEVNEIVSKIAKEHPELKKIKIEHVMALNRNGDLLYLEIKTPSPVLTESIKKLLIKASESFPPVPSCLKGDHIIIPFLCKIPLKAPKSFSFNTTTAAR